MKTYTLTEAEVGMIVLALGAAQSRWTEWSEELALPEVAESFSKQAKEVERLGTLLACSDAVSVTGGGA